MFNADMDLLFRVQWKAESGQAQKENKKFKHQ